ncbi:MAG: DUF177 domain-containing protein [Deltaproteobacteria bacterium]|nr:MAG: DUF177 domain-containing protein [Deltaproteobacteria bacterium]
MGIYILIFSKFFDKLFEIIENMRIRWEDIPPEGLKVGLDGVGELDLHGPKGSLEEDLRLVSSIEGEVELRRKGDGVKAKGWLKTAVFIKCARCLKEFELPISSRFEGLYLHIKYAPHQEEVELSREDMEVTFLLEEVIDLGQMIHEQIWIHIPMKPLCKEDCKGLCPLCGADLNEGECGCKREEIDPRFAVLKGLKLKR